MHGHRHGGLARPCAGFSLGAILTLLDLFGVAVFAASGVLAALHAQLDLLGIVVLASITAIGGGTLRDVLLNRHPVFWISDPRPIYAILAAVLVTLVAAQFFAIPVHALLVADAVGLALFALSGAQLAERGQHPWPVVVFMGTLTGVGGGVMRDVMTAQIPLILHKDIYATAAIIGIVFYLVAQRLGLGRSWAYGIGLLLVAGLRLVAIHEGWQLPRV